MPKQYTLDSLMDGILEEVESQEYIEKTASEQVIAPEMYSEAAQHILKVAQDLRTVSEEDVSYEDLQIFLEKHAGITDWPRLGLRAIKAKAKGPATRFANKMHTLKQKAGKGIEAIEKKIPKNLASEDAATAAAAAKAEKGWKPWQVGAGIAGVGALGAGGFMGGRALASRGNRGDNQ
jgi:hypothetical protein